MLKYSIILLALFFFIIPGSSSAQLSPEQEKRLEDLEQKSQAWDAWKNEKPGQNENLLELKEQEKEWKAGTASSSRAPEKELPGLPIGRFQAVQMNNSTIMILDTMEGHLWVWISQPDKSGKSSEFLIYQGKVVPGSKMGEIIDRTFNK